jgi:DNA-binding IclR family transcriptional regulator
MKQDGRKGIMIQSVERALTILMLVGESGHSLSAVEISRQTGINRTTVYALLNTLEAKHFISKDNNTGFYTIGPIPYQLGFNFQNNSSLIAFMEKESSLFTEKWKISARLGIYNGAGKLLVLLVQSPYEAVSFPLRTGMTFPMHAFAMGKALLAYFSTDKLNHYLQNYPLSRQTATTIVDADKLKQELHEIREKNYAVNDNEYIDGIFCIAAPIRDSGNNVIAAVSLSGESQKVRKDFNDIIRDVQVLARLISIDLGWRS